EEQAPTDQQRGGKAREQEQQDADRAQHQGRNEAALQRQRFLPCGERQADDEYRQCCRACCRAARAAPWDWTHELESPPAGPDVTDASSYDHVTVAGSFPAKPLHRRWESGLAGNPRPRSANFDHSIVQAHGTPMPLPPTSRALTLLAIGALLLAGCSGLPWKSGKVPDGARAKVAILETTDIHANVLGYDYYKLKPDPTVGFERTATLIRRARKEFPNNFLFDAGDTIQGSVLADYQALVKPVSCDQELAVYRAMDAVGYDGGTIGNHEFNYGLGFLSQVTGTPMNVDGGHDKHCAGPHYPLVLANVFGARDGKPLFKPW